MRILIYFMTLLSLISCAEVFLMKEHRDSLNKYYVTSHMQP
ncbi:hypothetical protein [Bdellovibrio sp. NC01]|nr:hypothetical protein [Bdellovibrio sp. NC01]